MSKHLYYNLMLISNHPRRCLQRGVVEGQGSLSKHMPVAQTPARWLNAWARGLATPRGDAEQYLRKGHGGEAALAKAKLPHQKAENRAPTLTIGTSPAVYLN